MKYFAVFLLLTLSCLSHAQDTIRRPKIGLVLSGGGAKGFAHVGALKVIEEVGIPIDYITGTSIGSIVGGLYAIGYDSKALEEMVAKQNWAALLSNSSRREYVSPLTKEDQSRYLISFPVVTHKIQVPVGVLNGQNVMDLFSYLTYGFHGQTDFTKFPIPFKCIAADFATGQEVVLDHGFLPKAMRASMAVPAAFAACEIDGRMLVDGGLVNNFPVDRCREMGADIIIGIDIQDDLLEKDRIKSIPDVINQLTSLMSIERSAKNRKKVNILIRPDITGFSGASFDTESANILMSRGEGAARRVIDQLIRLRDSLGLKPMNRVVHKMPDGDTLIHVSRIEVEGTDKNNITSFLGKMGIEKDERVTLEDIREGIARIYASGNYSNVEYKITGEDKKTISVSVKEVSTNKLNIGLRYDTDLKASALINATIYSDRLSNSNLSLDAKLATSPMFGVRYSLDRGWRPGLMASVSFISDRIWGYENNTKNSEVNVQLTNVQLATQAVISNTFRIMAGGSIEHFHFGNILGISNPTELADATFLNYFAKVSMDMLDKYYFPEKGWAVDANFKVITDNGLRYNHGSPVALLGFTTRGAMKVSDRITLLPSFYSQFTLKSTAPVYYRSYVGGYQRTNYFGGYLPFVGLRRMELSADNMAIARFDVRLRMWEKIYVSLNPNMGFYGENENPLTQGKFIFGSGLTAAYDSTIGPIEFAISGSTYNHSVIPFFSLGYSF